MNEYSRLLKVETTCRRAQCTFNFDGCNYHKSNPFSMAIWNWHFSGNYWGGCCVITLFPEIKDRLPIASLVIRFLDSDKEVLEKTEVRDKLLNNDDGFLWRVGYSLPERFIIDLEFLELKASSPNGGDVCSIWPRKIMRQKPNSAVLQSLGQMLVQGIHTDITINASDGSIEAHRAVLAARSPVFRGMFSHNLKENDDSTINISDMSIESCRAFIKYLYGIIEDEEFLKHRLELVRAADKYDICDLRDVCIESLAEDIDSSNVLERLQNAHLYQLPKLKLSCMEYLVKYRKIFDIKDDFNAFLQTADKDLTTQIFDEVFSAWKSSLNT